MPVREAEGLRFVRLFDFDIIPDYLIDQIKGRTWDKEKLYKLGGFVASNPFTFVYALSDHEHKIKGFVWAMANLIDDCLYINACSIDKEYQKKRIIQTKVVPFLHRIRQELQLSKARALTTRPKAFEKMLEGVKRSKETIIEWGG